MPLIVHANGPAKVFQKTLAIYILNQWNPEDGCLSSSQDTKDMNLLEVLIYRINGN